MYEKADPAMATDSTSESCVMVGSLAICRAGLDQVESITVSSYQSAGTPLSIIVRSSRLPAHLFLEIPLWNAQQTIANLRSFALSCDDIYSSGDIIARRINAAIQIMSGATGGEVTIPETMAQIFFDLLDDSVNELTPDETCPNETCLSRRQVLEGEAPGIWNDGDPCVVRIYSCEECGLTWQKIA